jgi:hypothetical protein
VTFQGNYTTIPAKDSKNRPALSKDNGSTSASEPQVATKKTQAQASKSKQVKPKKVQGISSGMSVVIKRNAKNAKTSSRANYDPKKASGSLDKRALNQSHKQGSMKGIKTQTQTQGQGDWWKELN